MPAGSPRVMPIRQRIGHCHQDRGESQDGSSRFKPTLILTFSLREKELPLPFSPFGRDGREAPVRALERAVGERWGEGCPDCSYRRVSAYKDQQQKERRDRESRRRLEFADV